MKKLMIALASAASAFGLYADVTVPNGTSFESAPASGTVAEKLASVDAVATWTVPAAADALSFKAYGTEEIPYTPRPDQFNTGTIPQDSYLGIQSAFTDPAVRTIDGGVAFGAEGLYVDSLVKFTAVDGDDTIEVTDGNAKIAIWTQEELDKDGEPSGVVNLKATAGKYVGGVLQSDKAVYNLGALKDPSDWHRLTIKAINGGNAYGFVVYIDQTVRTLVYPTGEAFDPFAGVTLNPNAAAFNAAGNLIPSLAGFSGLSALAVAGQGAIDDISFTQTKPEFAADNKFFTATGANNVEGFFIGEQKWVEGQPAISVLYDSTLTYQATGITYKAGYFGATEQDLTASENAALTVGVAKALAITIGDQKFANFAEAIAAIKAGTATGDLKLEAAIDLGTDGLTVDTAMTIDLNGKTLTLAEDSKIIYSSSLTVIDSSVPSTGKIVPKTGASADPSIIEVEEDAAQVAVLTIQGGTIDGSIAAGEQFVITGGKFIAEKDAENFPYTEENPWTIENRQYTATLAEGYWTVTASPWVGDGTEENPYQVATEADLIALANVVNGGESMKGSYFKQQGDITLKAKFIGIGVYDNTVNANAFSGIYDGNGYSVKNMVCADGTGVFPTANNYRGLFNQINGATIKNLTVEGTGFGTENLPSGEYGAAIICGTANYSIISNCVSKGTIASSTHNAAGIVIRVNSSKILYCTNKADITGNYTKVAGIVVITQNGSGSLIEGCVNEGTIAAGGNVQKAGLDGVAGIIAYVADTDTTAPLTVKDCENKGVIKTVEDAYPTARLGQIIAVTYYPAVLQGEIKGTTAVRMIGDLNGKAIDRHLATVDGDVATFIADSAIAAGNTYLVMATGAAPTIQLAAGESISFDISLAALASDTGITTVEGNEVKSSTEEKVTTYTSTKKTIAVTGVTLDASTQTLKVGENFTLTATVAPAEASDPSVSWSSSDETVATVDGGVVTAVAAGTATITVKTTDGGFEATCVVTVETAAKPTPYEPIPATDPAAKAAEINASTEAKKAVMAPPQGATVTDTYYTYFSAVPAGDAAVAMVLNEAGTNAVVTAEQAAGTAALTAVAGSSEATTSLTIAEPVAGFYYSLKQSASVKTLGFKAEGDKNKLAGKDTISFTLDKSATSGFYQTIVTPLPQE